MFYTRLWSCLQGEKVYIPLGRHSPQADTPQGRHPQADTSPRADTPFPRLDGHCSGRYASYWNDFNWLFMLSDVAEKLSLSVSSP